MKINKYLWLFFMFTATLLVAQTKDITGTVTEEGGVPLPGANVMVENSSKVTITDFDGNYSIKAEEGDVLTFSYIGYLTKSITVGANSTINVSLATDTQALDEVVVVGYGTQKKSVVTGAISSVKAEDLQSMPINDVGDALQGRTSGVTMAASSGQPGSGSTIRVRGITSRGNSDPLWVVDGVVVDNGGINYLNPSDIESMEVLKDAASQAIYGARAAAGVILVTTKKGKQGKMSVSYNGYAGLSSPSQKVDLTNASQYAMLQNEASVNDGGSIIYSDPSSLGNGTDWQDEIFNKSAFRQNQEISISGGNEVSTFYGSFGYLDQEGIVASDISNYERYNVRLNSTHNITDWLRVGENLGYSYEKSVGLGNTNSEFGGPLSSALNLDPLTPVVITDPNVASQAPYTNTGAVRDANGNPYGVSSLVQQEMANPLAYIKTREGNYGFSNNIVGNAFLEVEPIAGLKFRSSIGTKMSYWGGESFTPIYYLNASTNTNQTSFNRNTSSKMDYNIENTVIYTKDFENHGFSILLGQGAYRDSYSKSLGLTKYDIPVDNFDDGSLNFGVPISSTDPSGSEGTEHKVSSLFTRVTYNYKEKYLFNGILRRDGSSRFGGNNKYGVFPSVSLGWVVSKEGFWPENEAVNTLKLRGGYGVVGNDNIGDFAYTSTIGSGRNYTFGSESTDYSPGYSPNAPANPDLKWEETSQLNIGFETRLFSNFRLEFDWYKKETSDMLQRPYIPLYVGAIENPARNIGTMENRGVELNLGYNKDFGDFGISVNANASYLENEVTYLGNESHIDEVSFQGFGNQLVTRTEVGRPLNSFYGYQTLGVFQNQQEIDAYVDGNGNAIQPNAAPGDFKWQDTNGDGVIAEDDRVHIGNPTPDWSYGLTIKLDYKNIDFTVFGQGVAGNQIFQGLRRLDIPNANYQASALGRWTGEGSTNSQPRVTKTDPNGNFSRPSDYYLENGDYFRIKTMQLGYTFSNELVSKLKIQHLRLYIMGENLLTFTDYTGFDPEIGGGVFSVDRGVYPQARSFMLGASINFF